MALQTFETLRHFEDLAKKQQDAYDDIPSEALRL